VEPLVSGESGSILFIGLVICVVLLFILYFALYRRRKLRGSR
jgi:LPXTG-motif cell wall-anchored protein